MDVPPPPTHMKGNLQQLLRWGFRPEPPPRISAAEYMRGPGFWVGKVIPSLGKIASFDEGILIDYLWSSGSRVLHVAVVYNCTVP
jgi:hypothetical protein